jgi:hypothetical protein
MIGPRARRKSGGRAVTRLGAGCALVATVCLGAGGPADAASFILTPAERDEAIRLGKRSIVSEEFGGEWKVGGERPGQSLMVMTPFHRLALAARNSAFKSQELPAREVEALLKGEEGRLTLWAALQGEKADFARFYTPVLVTGQQEIKATFRQNEHTGRREESGSYTARCLYVFPAERLAPNQTLVLIVRDPDDKPVARFTVHLAAMR